MDIKEYNLIVDKYSDDLFRFALRYTGDEDESNDAVQDSFVTLWEHRWEVGADGAMVSPIHVMRTVRAG